MTEALLILIGFSASLIGTLAGSGGMIGMPAMLLLGFPIHSVIATAKFSNIFASFSSFFVLIKQKELTFYDVSALIPFALLGGLIGGLLANSLTENTMNIIAVLLLVSAFFLSILKKPQVKESHSWSLPKKTYPGLFGISVYDGMFGPGQATLLMYTFLNSGAAYLKSLALTRFQTFISCLAAFITYLAAGNFMWEMAVFYALGSLGGAQTAIFAARRISTAYLHLILHSVTILLIIQLIYRLLF